MNYELRITNQTKVILLIFISLFINLESLFFNPNVALAQEISFSISPPLTELTIQPGKTLNLTFTVKDEGAPVVIAPSIVPFVPFDKEGHVQLIEDKNSIGVFSSWFSFDQTPVSLGTTTTHNFDVKISPPEGTAEKDYYFTFLVSTVGDDNSLAINSSQSQARIGANILISVSKDGNPPKKGSVAEFSAPKIIDSFTGLTYKIIIENIGSGFFKPVGSVTVNQVFGKTTSLNLAPLNILVGGARQNSCLSEEEIIPCKMPEKFLIGIYRANLSFTLDGSGTPVEKETYTIAFPFSIILGILIIIIIFRTIKKLTS
jgi:hypothetical protein